VIFGRVKMTKFFKTISKTKTFLVSVTAGAFFFSTMGAPFAEANFWQERRVAAKRTNPGSLGENVLSQTPGNLSPLEGALPGIGGALSLTLSSPISENLSAVLALGVRREDTPVWLRHLPSVYGEIRRINLAKGAQQNPAVVLIQDVHQVESAQKNISEILAHIEKSADGANVLVGVEGAVGAFDLAPLRALREFESHKPTCDFLLKSHLIAAPEYYGLQSVKEPLLWGVETPADYMENVQAYRASRPLLDQTKARLDGARWALTQKAKTILSPDLLRLDQSLEKYSLGEQTFSDYIQTLSVRVPEKSQGSETSKLLKALAMEKDLDFKAVERERAVLVETLVKKLDPRSVQTLVDSSLAYRLGRKTYGAYYRELKSLASGKGVRWAQFPVFEKYVDYVLVSESIDKYALFDQVEGLKTQAVLVSAQTLLEKEFMALSEDLRLVRRLVHVEFGPAEWRLYQTRRQDMDRLAERLSRVTGSKVSAPSPADLMVFECFYRAADKRNISLTENLLSKARETQSSVVVLIAGGFHTPAIETLMEKAGLSVVTVTPRVDSIPSGTNYLDFFTAKHVPIEELFSGERLYLATPNRLCRGYSPQTQSLLGIAGHDNFQALVGQIQLALTVVRSRNGLTAQSIKQTLALVFPRAVFSVEEPKQGVYRISVSLPGEMLPAVFSGDEPLSVAKTEFLRLKISTVGDTVLVIASLPNLTWANIMVNLWSRFTNAVFFIKNLPVGSPNSIFRSIVGRLSDAWRWTVTLFQGARKPLVSFLRLKFSDPSVGSRAAIPYPTVSPRVVAMVSFLFLIFLSALHPAAAAVMDPAVQGSESFWLVLGVGLVPILILFFPRQVAFLFMKPPVTTTHAPPVDGGEIPSSSEAIVNKTGESLSGRGSRRMEVLHKGVSFTLVQMKYEGVGAPSQFNRKTLKDLESRKDSERSDAFRQCVGMARKSFSVSKSDPNTPWLWVPTIAYEIAERLEREDFTENELQEFITTQGLAYFKNPKEIAFFPEALTYLASPDLGFPFRKEMVVSLLMDNPVPSLAMKEILARLISVGFSQDELLGVLRELIVRKADSPDVVVELLRFGSERGVALDLRGNSDKIRFYGLLSAKGSESEAVAILRSYSAPDWADLVLVSRGYGPESVREVALEKANERFGVMDEEAVSGFIDSGRNDDVMVDLCLLALESDSGDAQEKAESIFSASLKGVQEKRNQEVVLRFFRRGTPETRYKMAVFALAKRGHDYNFANGKMKGELDRNIREIFVENKDQSSRTVEIFNASYGDLKVELVRLILNEWSKTTEIQQQTRDIRRVLANDFLSMLEGEDISSNLAKKTMCERVILEIESAGFYTTEVVLMVQKALECPVTRKMVLDHVIRKLLRGGQIEFITSQILVGVSSQVVTEIENFIEENGYRHYLHRLRPRSATSLSLAERANVAPLVGDTIVPYVATQLGDIPNTRENRLSTEQLASSRIALRESISGVNDFGRCLESKLNANVLQKWVETILGKAGLGVSLEKKASPSESLALRALDLVVERLGVLLLVVFPKMSQRIESLLEVFSRAVKDDRLEFSKAGDILSGRITLLYLDGKNPERTSDAIRMAKKALKEHSFLNSRESGIIFITETGVRDRDLADVVDRLGRKGRLIELGREENQFSLGFSIEGSRQITVAAVVNDFNSALTLSEAKVNLLTPSESAVTFDTKGLTGANVFRFVWLLGGVVVNAVAGVEDSLKTLIEALRAA